MRIQIFAVLNILLAKKQAEKSHTEPLEEISASKCKETEWLRKGKCVSLSGVGESKLTQ